MSGLVQQEVFEAAASTAANYNTFKGGGFNGISSNGTQYSSNGLNCSYFARLTLLLGPSTIMAAWGIATALLAAWLFTHHYKLRNNTPLKDIPGPWLASCSPLYRFWYAVVKGNFHNDLTNLHRKYGDIVRIAPNEVSIWNPEAVCEIYAHGNRGYAKCDM